MENDNYTLFDIMLNGQFKGQIKYDRRELPTIFENGEVVEAINYDSVRAYVEEIRPSLKGKNFEVIPTTQRMA